MGLDMYAYKTKFKPSKEVDFQDELQDVQDELDDLHYWRKHPNLHGWMESLYNEKGGQEEFNCRPVQLTSEDIQRLATALLETKPDLPETTGFFFGSSEGSEDEIQDDLEFVKKAKQAIDEGYTVYYNSWW
jgi:hypothetical protein